MFCCFFLFFLFCYSAFQLLFPDSPNPNGNDVGKGGSGSGNSCVPCNAGTHADSGKTVWVWNEREIKLHEKSRSGLEVKDGGGT